MSATHFLKKLRPELPADFYWKELTDPLTGKQFAAIAVKSRAYSVRARDPDFRPHYTGINPLHYSVLVAPSGFAAEESVYKRSPTYMFKNKAKLVQLLKTRTEKPNFNVVRDIKLACESYEAALNCITELKIPVADVAALALKGSWIYLERAETGHDEARERAMDLRRIALDAYARAFESEDTTTLKIGSTGVAYLIAELLREQGKFDESLRWFSRVVTDRGAGGEVRRNARNQMELCREQRKKAKETGEYVKPEPTRTTERAMYQLYRDQVNWLAKTAKAGSMNESEIIRAVFEAIKSAEVDLSRFTSAAELTEWLEAKLID